MPSPRPAIRFVAQFSVAALIAWGAGCAQYQGKPLTTQAVDRQLALDDSAIRASAEQLKHPILQPLPIQLDHPISPDEAAVLAVVINPELRAERDQRGIADAQLLQAGILPNPQLTGGMDFPYDSSPPDNFTAYNVGLDWEVTSLITRNQKRRAATAAVRSVELDIAWKEWQLAQEARTAAYNVIALESQLEAAREADKQLSENLDIVRRAVEQHHKTLVDLAAAESAAQDAHASVIAQQIDLLHERLALHRALGLPAEYPLKLRTDEQLPSRLTTPSAGELLAGLEDRRLDLLALKRGYESQDATLRAAILAQFPKISLGFNGARDTSDVRTLGFGVTIDIPLFDRNQGTIANETATRQKLFDEYVNRVFVARSDLATALADIDATSQQIAAAEAAIPALENLVQTYRAAMRAGNLDVLSYYTAQGSLSQKHIDLIKLKQQLMQNWIALQVASGRYLPLHALSTTAPATREERP